jgi:hypothetical protein
MSKESGLLDIFIIVVATIASSTSFFGMVYDDSKVYMQMTQFFLGIASIKGIEGWVAARPLVPLLVSPLASLLWMPIAYGVLNSILWVLSAILMYDVTLRMTSSRQQALAAALLFTTSPPTLLYFGSVMLEAGGTFFSLLILWTYLRLQDRLSRLSSLLASALVGVGILSRETTLPVAAFILLLGIVARRIKWTFVWILSLIIPSAIWQCYTTLIYGENYWTHYVKQGLEYSKQLYGTSFYISMIDLFKALAWSHFPLAAICLVVGFLSLNEGGKELDVLLLACSRFGCIPSLAL